VFHEPDVAAEGPSLPPSEKTFRTARTLFIQVPGYEKLRITPDRRRDYLTEEGALRIPLARGGSISGTYSIAGRPRANVPIRLTGPLADHGLIRTDERGRFAWTDLPGGVFLIRGPFRYRLELGEAEKRTLDLGKELGTFTFSGRAGREGKPLADRQQIYLVPAFDWAFNVFFGPTDEKGNFRIEGLKAGKYRAYPGYPPSGANPGPNPYAPETIEIKADTRRDLDFHPPVGDAPKTGEPAPPAAQAAGKAVVEGASAFGKPVNAR